MLSKNALPKFPNLRDGLALSFAAANKGNSKAATRAREAAYMESTESLVDKVKNGLSYELPKMENAVLKTNENPNVTNLLGDPNTNPEIENFFTKISLSDENKEQNSDNPLLDTDISWQSKALGDSKKADEVETVAENGKSEQNKSVNYYSKSEYPKSFFIKELINKNENKNHVFHAAPDFTTTYYGSMDTTNDLTSGEYSRNNLLKLGGISEKDLSCSEEKHINNWKKLAKLTSVGEMQSVNLGLINHFVEGTGSDYSNATLTKAVREHSETKRYMSDFSKVFDAQLQLHNGDVSAFADSDDFHTALRNNDVLISKYDYSGLDDLFGGLEFAVHGWTESQVDISSLNIDSDGSYSGTLRFIFKDNFGLNDPDVEKYGKYHDGFKSWFILQHYDEYDEKYKPFKTVVEIDYPISGKIEGYEK